ncbi:MAG: CDP-alcohol phosphatidyltransferase family protein [Chlamydiia bacterium]|nr:CDP-alcohol phosphatidyltransferase family protein [Chlamydiia bacterium]
MIDSFFRAPVQKTLIDPMAWLLARFGVSPLLLTALASLVGVAAMPLIAYGFQGPALACLLLSGYLDAVDGSVARRLQRSSDFGAACDICSDRLVESCTIMGLCLYAPAIRGPYCLAMLSAVVLCVTTFLVVGIFTQNSGMKSFHYSPGLMERAEAFLFFGAMILWPSAFFPLSILFTVLVLWTALQRLVQFGKQS